MPMSPLETAWAPCLAALLALAAAWSVRRTLFARPGPTGLLLLASVVLIRLVLVPGWTDHVFDGHEAEYWDLFRGVREPTRGGTVLYPLMQWWWWGLGRILPHDPHVPGLITTLLAAGSIAALAASVGALSHRTAAWGAAALLVFHPVHAAWSSSAYNVMLPHALGCLALWATVRIGTAATRDVSALAIVASTCLALVAASRLDAATMWLPCVSAALFLPSVRKHRGRLLLPAVIGITLTILSVRPLIWPGPLPGAGERILSFWSNLTFLQVHAPFHGLAGAGAMVLLLILAAMRWPRATLILAPVWLVQHLVMATFDDYGARHTLPGLVALAWIVGAGLAAAHQARGWRMVLGVISGLVLSVLCGTGLWDLKTRFYGDEDAYAQVLAQPPWSELERRSGPPEDDCGWVTEDDRVAGEVPLSHFNLLDPDEADRLRGSEGCLWWCADVMDWTWSSRSVRDRALRLAHMYSLSPSFVVEETVSGYQCVGFSVGPRRSGTMPTGHRVEASLDHGRAHPDDSRIP